MEGEELLRYIKLFEIHLTATYQNSESTFLALLA